MDTWPRLRQATNADGQQIADLVHTVLREYHLRPDPDCTDADLRDIQQSYFARGGTFRVLETQDGRIIGAYGLYPISDCGLQLADSTCQAALSTQPGACELRKMYLHRNYRGKGLGRHLLEEALADARRLGFTRITLETASVLKEAIALYEGYGFVPYQPEHLSARCDQAYVLELR